MARHVLSRRVFPILVATFVFRLGVGPVRAQGTISADLDRAELLYYNAEFQSSLDLLLDLETRVGNSPQTAAEQLKLQLYLGLAYVALNNTALAKSRFVGVCSLDNKYTLDPQQFPSKVTTLFDEAKAACAGNYCVEICGRGETSIPDLNSTLERGRKPGANECSCPTAAPSPVAMARTRFERAEELYRKGQVLEASKEFSAALALDSSNELATQYLRLTEVQLELSTKDAFADWRRYFDSHEYQAAAETYKKIRSSSVQPLATQLTGQVEVEYGTTFEGLVKSWQAACEAGDPAKMASVRKEAVAVDSGLQFGTKAFLQMDQCIPKSCIQGDPVLALRRLKTRNNLEIDPNLQRYISRGVRVEMQIDESGNPKVTQVTNANSRLAEALKSSIEQWEFYPALVDGQRRCVQTELPITLIQH